MKTDLQTDPVAEAERALFAELFDEVENYAGITAAFERARKEEKIFALAHEGEVSFQRVASLARRYGAERALAALKYIERAADCDCSVCAAYLFVCEALEREIANAR